MLILWPSEYEYMIRFDGIEWPWHFATCWHGKRTKKVKKNRRDLFAGDWWHFFTSCCGSHDRTTHSQLPTHSSCNTRRYTNSLCEYFTWDLWSLHQPVNSNVCLTCEYFTYVVNVAFNPFINILVAYRVPEGITPCVFLHRGILVIRHQM
jgi:hypothetical protein